MAKLARRSAESMLSLKNISDKDNVVLRATAAREISFFWVNERRSGDLGIWKRDLGKCYNRETFIFLTPEKNNDLMFFFIKYEINHTTIQIKKLYALFLI